MKVQSEMATRITVDTVEAANSMKAFRQAITANTQAWKANEMMMKSANDFAGAAKERVEGLSSVLKLQEERIAELKSRMSGLDQTTKQGAEQYISLQREVSSAQKQLASYASQLAKAKTNEEYYTSGLADLQRSFKLANEATQAHEERLRAEGNEAEAAKTHLNSLRSSYENLQKQASIQVDELGKLEKSLGKTSEAYQRQQIRVDQTKTKIAGLKNEIDSLSTSGPNRLERLSHALDPIREKFSALREATLSWKNVIGANLISNAVTGAFVTLQTQMKSTISTGMEVAKAAGAIEARWKNIGVSSSGIKTMMANLKDLKTNTNLSADAVVNMQNKFYGLTGSVKQTTAITKGVGSLADQLKLSQKQADSFAGGLSRIEASGKVTAQSFNRLEKQAPGLSKALATAAGMSQKSFNDLLSSGKMTSDQFNDYLIKAGNDYQKNAKAFGKTSGGALHQLQQNWASTQAALAKPLVQVQATGLNELNKALNDKDTQRGIQQIGKSIAQLAVSLAKTLAVMAKHQKVVKALVAGIASMVIFTKAVGWIKAFAQAAKLSYLALGPWGLAIGAIVTALTLFYAKSKTFRNVVNGMAKAALSFGKSVLNFFKKDWKQLALLLVNPIAGGLALLYKHNKSFRNFCNTMVNDAKRAFKDLGKKFSDGWKTIQKATNNGAKNAQKSWNNFTKQTEKSTDNWWKSTKKNFATGWKQLQKETSNGVKFVVKEHDNLATQTEKGMQAMFRGHEKTFKSGYKVIQDQTRTWHDVVTGHWDRLSDDTSKTAQDMSKYHQNLFRDLYNKLNDMTGGRLGNMLKTFQSIFGSIKDAVGNAVGAVHNKFVNLVNGILRPFKTLIDNIKGGINWILDKVGASQIGGGAAISLVSYANGTDDTRDGHPGGFAKVNDGLTAHYREMYRLPNGQVGMFPAKRNMIVPLPKGTSVLDGERSYQLARLMGIIPHYADGIGDFFDSLLSKGKDIADDMLENVEKIMAHPIEFMKSVFHRFVKASSPVKFARQLITSVPEFIATKMKDWVKKQFEVLDNPGGAGVARWRPYIIRAFKQLGVEPAEWKVAKLLKQIQTESGGNPTIPQQISDINSANGTPAFGLLQFIPSTFNTWAVAGHHIMSKGYDQILAAINALQHGGEGGWGNVGMGHGWANGGLISQHGLYEVAENNLPEYVIPTDINKRSRAYQLLGEIVTRFRAEDQASGRITQNVSENNADSAALNRKLDAVLSKFDILLQLSGNQIQAIKDQGTFDTKSFYKKQARDLRMQQLGLGR